MISDREEREWWDEFTAEGHDRLIGGRVGVVPVAEGIAPAMGSLTESTATVVEIGSHTGRVVRALAAMWTTATFIGLDIGRNILNEAVKATVERTTLKTIKYVLGDGYTLPFGTGLVDAIFSLHTFQHLRKPNVAGYIHEAARVLRAGGRAAFQWYEGDRDLQHARDHTTDEMIGWCEQAGLRVVRVFDDPDNAFLKWRWVVCEN